MSGIYEARGVSADKKEVHDAIQHLSKGLFPRAFCKILPDIVAGDENYCNVMHADTAGTKTSLAYLYWKETDDITVWDGIAQDALVMNIDDMACVGIVDDIIISSTIGRNKHIIPGAVISRIINRAESFKKEMLDFDIRLELAGGETADVGDIVRTIDVGYTTFGRIERSKVFENNIQPGSIIVGLSSSGQCNYETKYNSGIGSNGLTSARHDVLSKYYANHFPESHSPETNQEYIFTGSKRLTDQFKEYRVGDLLLSPTRSYLPFLHRLFHSDISGVQGIIHCTGGAQTKVIKFIGNVEVIKDNLFPIPPVFEMIQQETKADWQEMYQVFNMGHRLEVYVQDEVAAEQCIAYAKDLGIDAKIIGHCQKANAPKVTIKTENGIFTYE